MIQIVISNWNNRTLLDLHVKKKVLLDRFFGQPIRLSIR